MFRFALSAALCLVYGAIAAQRAPLRIILEVGGGISTVRGAYGIGSWGYPSEGIPAKVAASFGGGPQVLIPLGGPYAIQTGLTLGTKPYKTEYKTVVSRGQSYVTTKTTTSFTWLSLPVMFRYTVPGRAGFYTQLGPYIAWLLQQKRTEKSYTGNTTSFNERSYYHKLDGGVAIGLGATWPLSDRLALQTEIRDELGLTKITITHSDFFGEQETNALRLMVGLSIKL
jgi:hypothetical protein